MTPDGKRKVEAKLKPQKDSKCCPRPAAGFTRQASPTHSPQWPLSLIPHPSSHSPPSSARPSPRPSSQIPPSSFLTHPSLPLPPPLP
eukprot:8931132-Pyramimonas_sp.AAC.1